VSFNHLLADQPQPEIAPSAVILGEVHIPCRRDPGAGPVVRVNGAAVRLGNYPAILGKPGGDRPVQITPAVRRLLAWPGGMLTALTGEVRRT
jgi:hypothetical protein